MKRHEVPGTEDWFDVRDLGELTSAHQDEYLDLGDELREAKREAEREKLIAAHPGMVPDPDQEIPVSLTRKDTGPIDDLVRGWMLAGSSLGLPLPDPLPLLAANVLRKALSPVFSALNGNVPKPATDDSAAPTTSGSTSEATAGAPQPEPATESSATPAG